MITIVDYGMGNLRSVQKSLQRINAIANISSAPGDIINATKIILPGVGHFKKAIENLNQRGLSDALMEAVLIKKIPILGICLGMQLMTKHSEEGDVEGFGWIDGATKRFEIKESILKVPHMGWNTIEVKKQNPLSTGLNSTSFFYFVHSYYVSCSSPEDILYETVYDIRFVSGFQKENITGVQFHPEKSHKTGLQLLSNFINL